ncbi:GNAT family N-acetyltransferase [Bacillus haikouensis]|jgi:GNAT superfamily N-acetyltransferase|uniref:GNAT family N-acetyltransferase n=1 Tax=Bacillus haikouensis TaxID=1510468 RepID=UPI001FE7BEA3|nr:GNAT family N-acetyltransferase [Bacillus haikouensis]
MIEIKQLNGEQEWLDAYPVMKQLRPHLDESGYLNLIKEASNTDGYKLAALYEGGRIVAVTGFMPMVTLYNGKSIWVCDLVTDAAVRSNGHGKKLLNYVECWAKDNGYDIISLSSGLQRLDAHRFYEDKMDYKKKSYVYLKEL